MPFNFVPLALRQGKLWGDGGDPTSHKLKSGNSFRMKKKGANKPAGMVMLSIVSETEMVNDIMSSIGGDFVGTCFADVPPADDKGRICESLMGWYGREGGGVQTSIQPHLNQPTSSLKSQSRRFESVCYITFPTTDVQL